MCFTLNRVLDQFKQKCRKFKQKCRKFRQNVVKLFINSSSHWYHQLLISLMCDKTLFEELEEIKI